MSIRDALTTEEIAFAEAVGRANAMRVQLQKYHDSYNAINYSNLRNPIWVLDSLPEYDISYFNGYLIKVAYTEIGYEVLVHPVDADAPASYIVYRHTGWYLVYSGSGRWLTVGDSSARIYNDDGTYIESFDGYQWADETWDASGGDIYFADISTVYCDDAVYTDASGSWASTARNTVIDYMPSPAMTLQVDDTIHCLHIVQRQNVVTMSDEDTYDFFKEGGLYTSTIVNGIQSELRPLRITDEYESTMNQVISATMKAVGDIYAIVTRIQSGSEYTKQRIDAFYVMVSSDLQNWSMPHQVICDDIDLVTKTHSMIPMRLEDPSDVSGEYIHLVGYNNEVRSKATYLWGDPHEDNIYYILESGISSAEMTISNLRATQLMLFDPLGAIRNFVDGKKIVAKYYLVAKSGATELEIPISTEIVDSVSYPEFSTEKVLQISSRGIASRLSETYCDATYELYSLGVVHEDWLKDDELFFSRTAIMSGLWDLNDEDYLAFDYSETMADFSESYSPWGYIAVAEEVDYDDVAIETSFSADSGAIAGIVFGGFIAKRWVVLAYDKDTGKFGWGIFDSDVAAQLDEEEEENVGWDSAWDDWVWTTVTSSDEWPRVYVEVRGGEARVWLYNSTSGIFEEETDLAYTMPSSESSSDPVSGRGQVGILAGGADVAFSELITTTIRPTYTLEETFSYYVAKGLVDSEFATDITFEFDATSSTLWDVPNVSYSEGWIDIDNSSQASLYGWAQYSGEHAGDFGETGQIEFETTSASGMIVVRSTGSLPSVSGHVFSWDEDEVAHGVITNGVLDMEPAINRVWTLADDEMTTIKIRYWIAPSLEDYTLSDVMIAAYVNGRLARAWRAEAVDWYASDDAEYGFCIAALPATTLSVGPIAYSGAGSSQTYAVALANKPISYAISDISRRKTLGMFEMQDGSLLITPDPSENTAIEITGAREPSINIMKDQRSIMSTLTAVGTASHYHLQDDDLVAAYGETPHEENLYVDGTSLTLKAEAEALMRIVNKSAFRFQAEMVHYPLVDINDTVIIDEDTFVIDSIVLQYSVGMVLAMYQGRLA